MRITTRPTYKTEIELELQRDHERKRKERKEQCGRCGKELRPKEMGLPDPLCFKCEEELVGPAGICVGCGDSVGTSPYDMCRQCAS